jgi:hypothetical protein
MHEAPHHVTVLKNPPACDASRLRLLESSRIVLLFWGLGLRRRPLALGMLNAQRGGFFLTQISARGLRSGFICTVAR